jgi:hypothetical protein
MKAYREIHKSRKSQRATCHECGPLTTWLRYTSWHGSDDRQGWKIETVIWDHKCQTSTEH